MNFEEAIKASLVSRRVAEDLMHSLGLNVELSPGRIFLVTVEDAKDYEEPEEEEIRDYFVDLQSLYNERMGEGEPDDVAIAVARDEMNEEQRARFEALLRQHDVDAIQILQVAASILAEKESEKGHPVIAIRFTERFQSMIIERLSGLLPIVQGGHELALLAKLSTVAPILSQTFYLSPRYDEDEPPLEPTDVQVVLEGALQYLGRIIGIALREHA